MFYYDNKVIEINNMNVFGRGQIFAQLEPQFKASNIIIEGIFDDAYDGMDNIDVCSIVNNKLLYCVGYSDMYSRYRRFNQLKKLGYDMVSYISGSALISPETEIENGSIVNQGAIVDNFVDIGECCFVNLGSMISHHTKIKDNVFIAPGVNIAGYVTVEEGVFIGINSTIIDQIHIGEGAKIAGGAVVTRDVEPYTMVAGNPARVKKYLGR